MKLLVLLEIEAHLREVVTLRLDLLLKVRDILGDPVELILVCLGILWNLFAWERKGFLISNGGDADKFAKYCLKSIIIIEITFTLGK